MKSLYIAVQPVGSGFAKALQQELRKKVVNKIYRVDHARSIALARKYPRNSVFQVTPQTLNKVQQFAAFTQHNVSCPPSTTNSEHLDQLDCKTVFCRTLINSTGGKGIVEINAPFEQVPRAPLYTAYIPKKAEYRVHVFNRQVIDIQQKKKKRDVVERGTRIRNLANGYVYTRDGITPPAGMGELAVRAVAAVGYNYGAVDIIYNERRAQCFVLEVNSRPGLMNTTLERYSEALIGQFNLTRK